MNIYNIVEDNGGVKLPQKWIDHVVKFPESGMGYTNVTYVLADESVDGIVLNGEHCMVRGKNQIDVNNIIDIKFNG